jgi:hypothetical protein
MNENCPEAAELQPPITSNAALPAQSPEELLRAVWAQRIETLGLGTPALFLLELHRPLVNLGYHFGLLAEPFLGVLCGPRFRESLEALCASPKHYEAFLSEIEKRANRSSQ